MTTEKGVISVLPNWMGFVAAADQMPKLQPIDLNILTATAQPALHRSIDNRGGKPEGGGGSQDSATRGKNEMRETSTIDNHEMRDHAAVDEIDVHDSVTMENAGGEGTTTLTPSAEDAVKNIIPTTPDDVMEQHH
jgi:hypothetical protein